MLVRKACTSVSKITSEHGSTSVDSIALARAIVVAVENVAAVFDVHAHRPSTAATYGPGETIYGVAVRRETGDITIEIQVRVRYIAALPLPMVSDDIRRAARSAIAELTSDPVGQIDVAIVDLVVHKEG